MMATILTNSELALWQHCKRCWYIGYYRELRRRRAGLPVLRVGTLVHRGLQAYYREKLHPLEYVQAKAFKLADEYPEAVDEIAKEAELASIMLSGYLQWLEETGADADLEVYAAEQKIEVPLGKSGFILRGKLDARAVRHSNGARVFIEHKTVSNLVDLIKTAQTNPQFLTYELLELLDLQKSQSVGDRVDGTLLNMLRRVKRTAAAKPPFYARHEIHHNLEELRNHQRHVLSIAREIEAARDALDAGESHHVVCPPHSDRACTWCNYSDVCLSGMFDDGSDVEGYLAAMYEPYDPMERYDDDEEGEER
jgi:hypothetical protein